MLANITINAQYNVNGMEYNFKSAINPIKELIMHVINHNRGKGARLSFLLATTFALFGCGGGDDSSSGAGSATYTPPTSSASLSAYDTTYSTAFSETFEVDLSAKVFSSTGGGFKITEVDVLSSDNSCQLESINNTSFVIQASNTKVCDYRYHVMPKTASANQSAMAMSGSQAEGSSSALARVAVSEDPSETTLIPVSATTLINEKVSVDLKKELKNVGYDLTEEFTLDTVNIAYGHSSSVTINASNNQTFDYTPEASFTGIDRVLYSFKHSNNKKVLMGIVDIAVGYEANEGFIIDEKIKYPTVVHVNEKEEINLEDYVKSVDEDDFQLVYVETFDAIAKPKNNSLGNKIISFEASKPGYHYVSFGVSDHNGTYDMGLIRVEVTDPFQSARWTDISYGLDLFTAPLTAMDAASQTVVYDAKLTDSGWDPAIDMAGFRYSTAKNYCEDIGAKLPDVKTLQELTANTKLQRDKSWPTDANYLAYDDTAAAPYQVSLKDGDESATPVLAIGGSNYYVTCVKSGAIQVLLDRSDKTVVADNTKEAKVVVQLKLGNEVRPNTLVRATSSSTFPTFDDSVTTNDDGVATFSLISLRAEKVTLTFDAEGETVTYDVIFIGDETTAEVKSKTTVDNVPFTSVEGGQVTATLTDQNDNPVEGYSVTSEVSAQLHPDTGESVMPILEDETTKTDQFGEQKVRVKWDKDIATPTKTMTFDVTSSYETATGKESEFISSVAFNAYLCGGQVGDADKANAAGDCIKVAESGGKLYTGTPSVNFLQAIDYADYSSSFKESGSLGPKGGVFALFTQSQAVQLCTQYNDINLQGKNDWRLATKNELVNLYNTYSSMFTAKGWATHYRYWSSTPTGSTYYRVGLSNGYVSSNYYPSYQSYASCVSGS
ncbi:DUF1566 domain-containing protein [Vibrio sp. nBUS_14]|uniref:Lcl domain-containing protein n=1 Tax=Vibrio sp. nBUS_14 TaxID=3395321 RepID=UPI003EC11F5C